jgi:hypothetical protein
VKTYLQRKIKPTLVSPMLTLKLKHWSAILQFYLGGRKPGTLSELDKAYYNKFSNGFKGIQWIIEPSLNYIKFDDKSLLKTHI